MEIQRYTHRACNDGDGMTDEWDEEDEDGVWVRYEEHEKIISEIEEKIWKKARDLSGHLDTFGYGMMNVQYYKTYADMKKAEKE
jgi:hypothetical protein